MRAPRGSFLRSLLGAAFVSLLVATSASAQAVTALWYKVVPSSGTTTTRLFQAPADTLTFTSNTPSLISLNGSSASPSAYVNLYLAPPLGETFELGPYERVRDYNNRGSAAGLYLNASYYCGTTLDSRFVVLEQSFDSDFNMVGFAVNFQVRCIDGTAVYGELRMSSAVPLTIDEAAESVSPDPFEFLPRTQVTPNAVTTSNAVAVYGIRAAAPISITGGEYSINGGAFTAAPGTAQNGDFVTVRLTASPAYTTATSAVLTVAGVSSAFTVTTYTLGVPFTAVALQSEDAGNFSYSAAYHYVEARAPDWTVSATHQQGRTIQVTFQGGPPYGNFTISVGAPLDKLLAVGPYEDAYRNSNRKASPGIEYSGGGSCYVQEGRFVVHELELGSGTAITKLALSFQANCGSYAPVFGEIRINSAKPLPSMVPGPDTSPEPFALLAQSPVRAGALVRSSWTSVLGVNQPVPISVTGGEYSLNGGSFTSAPGMVEPGDHIIAQLIASSTPGAVTSANLTVGGLTAPLTVTTHQPGIALTGLYYRSTSGDSVGAGQTRLFLAPPSGLTATRSYDNGVDFALLATLGRSWNLHLSAAGGAQLMAGVYEQAGRNGGTQPGLNLGSDASSCWDIFGRFVVYEAVYASNGAVERFAADIEQRCNSATGAPLFAEIRFNSTIPFSALKGACVATASGSDGPMNCLADVALSQVAPTAGESGKDIVFTMEARNNGPDAAHDVTVATAVPASSVIWASPGCTAQSTTLYACAIGTVANGAVARKTIVMRRDSPGSVYNNALIDTTAIDAVAGNDTSIRSATISTGAAGSPIFRYRLYSPVTLEHHFTTDLNEYNVLGSYAGTWQQEGTVGKVLNNPGAFNGVAAVPYYRLYDTNSRWHHWTTDANEYYTLSTLYPWWQGEGVDGYLLPTQPPGSTPLYRLTYPPVPGLHHWTIDPVEYNALVTQYGWVGEAGSGFVVQ